MRKLFIGTVLILAASDNGIFAQETKEEKPAPAKKAEAPAKADAMKCCEGMEKMGEMKGEVKAKMEKMKEKMADKMAEKNTKVQTKESKDEKSQPAKDAHQH